MEALLANHKSGEERAADQMMAAINRFKAENPNEYQTISTRPFTEGIRKIERFLRSAQA